MSELTAIKALSPEVDILSVLSSPEPQTSAPLGAEDSAGEHEIGVVTPLRLFNRVRLHTGISVSTKSAQYKALNKPLCQEEIEDLYQDAIKLPPKEQESIDEELRAILVYRNITGKPTRVLGKSGKVEGLYIANWDLVPVPYERPVRRPSLDSRLLTNCALAVPSLPQKQPHMPIRKAARVWAEEVQGVSFRKCDLLPTGPI